MYAFMLVVRLFEIRRDHGNMEDYWRLKKSCVTAYLWSQGSDAPVQFRTTVTKLSIRVENVSLGNTIPSALCISFKANEKRDSQE